MFEGEVSRGKCPGGKCPTLVDPGKHCSTFIRCYLGDAENAGLENAGLENVGPNRRGGKGRTGKRGKIMCMGSEM